MTDVELIELAREMYVAAKDDPDPASAAAFAQASALFEIAHAINRLIATFDPLIVRIED